MCGIVGYLDTLKNESHETLHHTVMKMAETIATRGPDGSGSWCDAHTGLAFGHRRLAILDLSPAGHQPMQSDCGRFIITFNGEIYNFEAIKKDLDPDSPYRGHSDTEILLHAVREWGVEKTLTQLNGMFALALWDRTERCLYLARDRFGEKPLYYGWIGSTFFFGSQLKSFHKHPKGPSQMDRTALALYLKHGYVPAPYSILEQIQKLPPATYLTLTEKDYASRAVEIRPYWSARKAMVEGVRSPFEAEDAEILRGLEEHLLHSVKLRMVADVPLGAFLSGGIDSSLIVALMQAQSPQPVKTFTIGFSEMGNDEAPFAKKVATYLGTDHRELYVSPQEAMSVIPLLPSFYDEPFADHSQIPTYLVSKMARQHVTVSLSGDGGDEIFGGYNRYLQGLDAWERCRKIPHSIRGAVAKGISMLSPASWDSLFQAFSLFLPERRMVALAGNKMYKFAAILDCSDFSQMYSSLTTVWGDSLSVVKNASLPQALSSHSEWETTDPRNQMMYLDSQTYLPDDILVKVDRASMAVSLESRAPYLDHQIVEYAWHLPLSMKIRAGLGKWCLRQILDRYVPQELITRPKMGFTIPLEHWLRGPLRPWAEATLERVRKGNELEFSPIEAKWKAHLSGKRNFQDPLWAILMFQAWRETFVTNH